MKRLIFALILALAFGSCTAYPSYANMHTDLSHTRTVTA